MPKPNQRKSPKPVTKFGDISAESLKNLSKEEKAKLLEVIQAKHEILRKTKLAYDPHEKQLSVHNSQALERYLFCGNGYGKTTILVNEMHWAASGYNPITGRHSIVPATIYVVVDDPTKIDQTILPEYQKWHTLKPQQLHKMGKANVSLITYDNGSKIYFLTHEVNLLKVEGVEMHYLFFDEPPPKHIFVGLYRGGRKKDHPVRVLLAGTPLYQPWLRTDVYEPWEEGQLDNVECFRGDTSDNPHLDGTYQERLGKYLTAEQKATRFHGEFFDSSGQALAHIWQRKYHLVAPSQLQWDSEYPCIVAIDPHSAKPHHAVLLGCDRDNKFIVLRSYKRKCMARDFIKDLIKLKWFIDFNIVDIIYDSWGRAEMTSGEGFKSFGKVCNEVLHEASIGQARPTSFEDKLDEDFIQRLQELLYIPEFPDNTGSRVPGIRILDIPEDIYQKGVVRDFTQVQWQRDSKTGESKNKLDISNRDFLACVKYALASRFSYKKSRDKIYSINKPIYGFRTAGFRRRQSTI